VSNSLRILTYNTQMRSALMEMGFPPSIPPVYTAPERAKLISRAIIQSPVEIDVVFLNEIFDEPARAVLSAELESEFPFQVAKADTFHTRIVSPGISDDVMEKVWELTFGPLEDLSGLAMLKFEDSGLFLASRIPFATVPTPPGVQALLGPLAFPQGVPVVRFFMYGDSSDNDKFAAKGVLYAALKTPEGTRHVFLSHTQADTERKEENAGDREKQIKVAAAFIEGCIGQAPPFTEEVFFLGDLNIVGHGAQEDVNAEWTSLFGKPGAPMFDQLVDRWGRDQCPGGASGRTDPGFTADVVYDPVRQRLDYLFTSATSALAVQHLRVDKELADPKGLVPYLSDHQPLLADINIVTQFCTPATALTTPPGDIDFDHSDSLIEGMVRWYRFDVPGTYDVDFRHNGAETAFEIYLGDDFSTPQPPYREASDPERGVRFVLAAPFFIKVFLRKRHSESSYVLRTHRHQGRTWRDAIVLVPGQSRNEHFPNQPFNIDTNDADWDDSESKWFLVETPRIRVPPPIDLAVTVQNQTEDRGFGPEPTEVVLTLGRWDGIAPPASFMDQAGPDQSPLTLEWQAREKEHFFVLVQRVSGTASVVAFDIEVTTTLSLLIARPSVDMSLTCQEETSGWGADDIALEIRADGDLIADIPNSVIGDFEDDSVRHVGDKIPAQITAYTEGIEVKVIEEDDIDPDDVGSGIVPLVDDVVGAPGFTVLHPGSDGTLQCSLTIGVDDGRYAFMCRIARWHPLA
jgi:endonuclease/exonuclease/phosphatase family metal-dependent hydrolase